MTVTMAMNMKPALVCFDLGGVVVRICRNWGEGCAAAGLPLREPERREATTLERAAAVVEYQTGRIDGAAFARRISDLLGGSYTPDEVMAVHRAWILGDYPGVDAAIHAIHAAGIDTAALSNTNHEHWTMLERSVARRLIRAPHASHIMGLHKPDPAIYLAFERLVGRRGEEILFFDDLPENIEAAQGVGWRAEWIDPRGETAAQILRHVRAHGAEV